MKLDLTKLKENFVKKFAKSEEGSGQSDPSPTEGDVKELTEEIVTELQQAAEAGTVQVTEAGVTAWAKEKGLSEEQTAPLLEIAKAVEDKNVENKIKSSQSKEIVEGAILEFRKALDETHAVIKQQSSAIAALIQDNKASLGKNEELNKTVTLLKSELEKIGSLPVGGKATAKSIEDIPSEKTYSRDQIVGIIRKGVKEDQLSLNDMTIYESNGVLTNPVKEFMKSQEGK